MMNTIQRLSLTLVCLFIGLYGTTLDAAIWYVNINATGANDGTSWTDAFVDLQDGIGASTIGDQIWVAAGTYKPTTTTTQSTSFEPKSGVGMYGGFVGTETQLSQRDWTTNVTTLSGEIGSLTNPQDNTWHVLWITNAANNTRIDGFRVINGYADGGFSNNDSGGGMLTEDGTPTIANCSFLGNFAKWGGGMAQYGSGSPNILHCSFEYNNVASSGGGIYMNSGYLTIKDCKISNNHSDGAGGGIELAAGITTIDRCIISGNDAYSGAGLSAFDYPTFTLANSLLIGNQSDIGSAVNVNTFSNNLPNAIVNCTIAHNRCLSNSSVASAVSMNGEGAIRNSIIYGNIAVTQVLETCPTITNCIIQYGQTCNGNNVPGVLESDPQFIMPGSPANAPFDGTGLDYHLGLLSPAVNAGNNSYVQSIYFIDLDSVQRIHDGTVDLGAYEAEYCLLTPTINASGALSFCAGGSVTLTAVGGSIFQWSNGSTTPTITANASANLTVIVADTNGCRGQATANVIVLPASVNITGPNIICQGGSVTLTAAGNNNTYMWSDGQSSASAIIGAPGTYSVTATSTNGCISSDTILITQSPAPTPVITQFGQSLQTGNYASFQWFLNGVPIPASNANSIIPVSNGSYTVMVTNSAGCQGTSAPFVVITIAITDPTPFGDIAVAPNPAHDLVHITFDTPLNAIATMELWALDGHCLQSTALRSGQTTATISVAQLPAGCYILKISTRNHYHLQRLIVE